MLKLSIPFTYVLRSSTSGQNAILRGAISKVNVGLEEKASRDLPVGLRMHVDSDDIEWHRNGKVPITEFLLANDGLVCPGRTQSVAVDKWKSEVSSYLGGYIPHTTWKRSESPVGLFLVGDSKFHHRKRSIPADIASVSTDNESDIKQRVIETAPSKLMVIDGQVYITDAYVWVARPGQGVEAVPLRSMAPDEMCFRIDRYEDAADFQDTQRNWISKPTRARIEYFGKLPDFDQDARVIDVVRAVVVSIAENHQFAKELLAMDAGTLGSYGALRNSTATTLGEMQPILGNFLDHLAGLPETSKLRREIMPKLNALAKVPALDPGLHESQELATAP